MEDIHLLRGNSEDNGGRTQAFTVLDTCISLLQLPIFDTGITLVSFSEITSVKCIYPVLNIQAISVTITSSPQAISPLNDLKGLLGKQAIYYRWYHYFHLFCFSISKPSSGILNYAETGSYILQFQKAKQSVEK